MNRSLALVAMLSCLSISYAWADSAAGADDSVSRDVYMKSGKSKGVAVSFDCNYKEAKSPYCLIHVQDRDNGVVCYSLVSTDKVVNPSLSCVRLNSK